MLGPEPGPALWDAGVDSSHFTAVPRACPGARLWSSQNFPVRQMWLVCRMMRLQGLCGLGCFPRLARAGSGVRIQTEMCGGQFHGSTLPWRVSHSPGEAP